MAEPGHGGIERSLAANAAARLLRDRGARRGRTVEHVAGYGYQLGAVIICGPSDGIAKIDIHSGVEVRGNGQNVRALALKIPIELSISPARAVESYSHANGERSGSWTVMRASDLSND